MPHETPIHVDRRFCFRNKKSSSRHFTARTSFAFETTLSGRSYLRQIDEWQKAGYRVKLIFLQLASAEEAIARVAQRVKQGGHHIPEDVIRRCFAAGKYNF